MNYRSVSIACLLMAAIASVGQARHPIPVYRPPFEVEVLINGVPQPQYERHGIHYLPVRQLNVNYVVRIRNHTARRFEAVLSVDGLSVINGQPASEHIRGYLLPAYGSVEIPGWRRGDERVAAFEFTRYEDSYAYLMGRPGGIGVIQLVAFEEQVSGGGVITPRSSRGGEHLRAGPAATSEVGRAPRDRVGTGYGEEIDHRVMRVPFVRGPVKHRQTIHYHLPIHRPRPFEAPADDNFTPPPPGYRG